MDALFLLDELTPILMLRLIIVSETCWKVKWLILGNIDMISYIGNQRGSFFTWSHYVSTRKEHGVLQGCLMKADIDSEEKMQNS